MKTDALRSVLFLSFPRVLTFTLQRLVFDYETFKRVKNSSEFPFPYELNMNPYLNEDSPDFKESKPLMYDLYSVLIHSGSAHSGHYHAYIRDTNSTVQDETGIDGQGSTWFDFNDSTVSSIPKERIEAQFGGNQECAYMLFYSKREATTTTTTSTANLTATGQQLPAVWLQERMAAENRQLELDREAYLTAQAALSLTVYPHTSLTVVGQEDAKDLNRPARHIVQQQQPQGREAAAGLKIDFDSRKSFGEFAEVLVARCAAAEVELDSVLSQLYEFQQEYHCCGGPGVCGSRSAVACSGLIRVKVGIFIGFGLDFAAYQ
jgi:hypothetical protein